MYNKNISSSEDTNPDLINDLYGDSLIPIYLKDDHFLALLEENIFNSVKEVTAFTRSGITVKNLLKKTLEEELERIDTSEFVLNREHVLALTKRLRNKHFIQLNGSIIILKPYTLTNANKQSFLNFLNNIYMKMMNTLSEDNLPQAFYPADHVVDEAGTIQSVDIADIGKIKPAVLSRQGIEIIKINTGPEKANILIPLKMIPSLERIIEQKMINYTAIFSYNSVEYFDTYLNIPNKNNCPRKVKEILAAAPYWADQDRQAHVRADLARKIMREIIDSKWKNYFLDSIVHKNEMLKENQYYIVPQTEDFWILALMNRELLAVQKGDNNPLELEPRQILDKIKKLNKAVLTKEQIQESFSDIDKSEFDLAYNDFINLYSQQISDKSGMPEIIALRNEQIAVSDKLLSFVNESLRIMSENIVRQTNNDWVKKITELDIDARMFNERAFSRYINYSLLNLSADFFNLLYDLEKAIEKDQNKYSSPQALQLEDIVNHRKVINDILKISREQLYHQALQSEQIGFWTRLFFRIKVWFNKQSLQTANINNQTSQPVKTKSEQAGEKPQTVGANKKQVLFDMAAVKNSSQLNSKLDELWSRLELPNVEKLNRADLDLAIKDLVRDRQRWGSINRNTLTQVANEYFQRLASQTFGLKNNKDLNQYIYLKMIDILSRVL